MSLKSKGLEAIIAQAHERERAYDWLGASESYERALGLISEHDFSAIGDKYERLGYAFFRASMQSVTKDDFIVLCNRAVVNYRKAKEFYERLIEQNDQPKMIRCEAMIAYISYWLAKEATEKKRLIDDCWKLIKKSLNAFDKSSNASEYVRTFLQLSSAPEPAFAREWDFKTRENIIREAIECGEHAITLLLGTRNTNELTRIYTKTAIYMFWYSWNFIPNIEERDRYYQKGLIYWQKAKELSEETTLLELLSISGHSGDEMVWSIDEILLNYGKASEYARKTKDKYFIGNALDMLAYANYWKSISTDDPDKRQENLQRALQYAESAKDLFSTFSFISPRGDVLWTGVPEADYYCEQGVRGTDERKRSDFLKKAVEYATNGLKLAENSGYPNITQYVHHILSKILVYLAQTETGLERKRELLKKALEHRSKYRSIVEQLYPFAYWNQGVFWDHLARIKTELSDIEENPQNKRNLLEEAVSDRERGISLFNKELLYWESKGELTLFVQSGLAQYNHGGNLNRLFEITNNPEYRKRAIKAFEEAIVSFQKLELVVRIAECYWKIAEADDSLGEHLKAVENFSLASINYKNASEKIPQIKDFFQRYELYMDAWGQIEKARHHHIRQEYGLAKEYYEKAAGIHKQLKQWEYLALNYYAWAQIENAEDLSRNEKSEQAIQSFKKAIQLFEQSKTALEGELDKIENLDEKQMVTNLVQAANIRREYCAGRIVLEEAKIFDRKGDHHLSSEKFAHAAETFERIMNALETEAEKKEFELIVTLAKAWQKMTQAEAEMSPALYLEASQLFEHAKNFSLDEKTKTLTLGHYHFCKALESGTKFVDTMNMAMRITAIQELESATDYYLKAGFQNASEYAKATELLFDAYVYIDQAKKETDPEKKAKFYIMSEKVLETSASHYEKAEHPEKCKQVLRLLEEIKKEKEFALSLAEVLRTPLIISTTSFPVPSPTIEKPVGSERFEHADIQAHLKIPEEIEVGEDFEFLFDVVNVGNNHGLLVRIDNIIPSGLKITSLTPQYNIEDSSINLNGKRIEPLKIESIKLNLQATKTGVVNLKPQVTYVDDIGRFRTSRSEPSSISVHPKLTFEFKTEEAKNMFTFLINSFVDDYMKRRISLEKSGWRTLLDIVKGGNVPKSSLYGVGGRRGQALSELERRGLVEARIFTGERGRGGNIVKVRIPYDKETIKRYIDEHVMKNKEK